MKRIILLSSIIILTQMAMAESPINKEVYIEKPTVCPNPQPMSLLVKPKDYSVSLLTKGSVDICKGVIIAPSWILTAKHCVSTKLSHITNGERKDKLKIDKKIRFQRADMALLKLKKPVFLAKNIVTLSAQPLLKEYGIIDYKKVTHNASKGMPRVYTELKLKVKSQRGLKSLTPAGISGSSGSPWVVNTDIGDVVIGITHGGGRAPQVSLAKKWIDTVLKKNTPDETVKWLNNRDVIIQSQ